MAIKYKAKSEKHENSEVIRHEYWMAKAIALARRGEGKTRPNPPVGAILVRGNSIIAQAFHRKAGSDHAEIKVLKSDGLRVKGCTLYVTLEPCCTWGKTPPCTDAIIDKGISQVVISVKDPNPHHNGRGCRILKKAGISVIEGICAEKGQELIAPFKKWTTCQIPYFTLKMAMSLDGKIADMKGQSKWITCPKSRKLVKEWREKADAILIGRHTACMDNPSLLSSLNKSHETFRIIVDTTGKLPLNLKILNDSFVKRTIIATTRQCSERKLKSFTQKGALVLVLPSFKGMVSMNHLAVELGKMGFLRVLCEGGGELADSLVQSGLVDEYLFFIAPRIIGGTKAKQCIAGTGWLLHKAPKLKFIDCKRVGDDILLRAVSKIK